MDFTWTEVAARLRLSPGNVSYIVGMFALAVAVSRYSWKRGDRTDRIAAATFILCWGGSIVAMWTSGLLLNDLRPPIFWRVIWDVLTASAFLYAALRRQTLWYGLAAMAQGVQMAGRALDIVVHESSGPLYYAVFAVSDLMNFVMMGAMIAAVRSGRATEARPALR